MFDCVGSSNQNQDTDATPSAVKHYFLIGARAMKMANIIPVKSIRLHSCGNIFLLVPIFLFVGNTL